MKNKIIKYLQDLEQEKDIKILLAVETGSRAWGFPSPDSDFDVRVIYVHRNDWYLSINNQKDSIDLMLENNDIDISGWELRKSLNLLKKSNPALLERIQSPIVYLVDEDFSKDVTRLANDCYSKIATMHHYLSMAKKMMDDVLAHDEFKLKRFFYALRTATLCKWIIEKESIPPIDFHIAYKNLNLSEEVVNRINELIELKSTKSESYMHTGETLLKDFITDSLAQAEKLKDNLSAGNGSTDSLNKLLAKYVSKYDH